MKSNEPKMNEEFNIKDAVIRLHELLGDYTVSFEYDELPNKEVILTVGDKENDND